MGDKLRTWSEIETFDDIVLPEERSPFNPIYKRHVSLAIPQLYCMGSFESCIYYVEKLLTD
jgi:hypothetical protein